MSVQVRSYNEEKDFELVGDFLIDTYQPGENSQNWLQPRWEYMHYTRLPFHEDQPDLKKIGIFESSGDIVGVVHFEDELGDIWCCPFMALTLYRWTTMCIHDKQDV